MSTQGERKSGVKPDLSHLCLFVSRVYCRKTGKRPAKLDRYCFTGILLGFPFTDSNIRYIETTMHQEKLAHHSIIDEACYTSPLCPLVASFLYNLGLPPPAVPSTPLPSPPKPPIAHYSIFPSKSPSPLPLAAFHPLPIPEFILISLQQLKYICDVLQMTSCLSTSLGHTIITSWKQQCQFRAQILLMVSYYQAIILEESSFLILSIKSQCTVHLAGAPLFAIIVFTPFS